MRITKTEEELIGLTEKNILLAASAVLFVLGCFLRGVFAPFVSADYRDFLKPWYDVIAEKGFSSFGEQVGNYNIPYQLVIYLISKIGIPPLAGYKAVSVLFDVVLSAAAGLLVSELLGNRRYFAPAFSAVWLIPTVFLNSSCWAQCDSVYASFALFALYFLLKEKYLPAFVMYGIAFSFKLQAIFLLPFLLMFWFLRRNFTVLYFALIPLIAVITSLPAVISGRGPFTAFSIYFTQTGYYKRISMNYPGFLNIIAPLNTSGDNYEMLKTTAVIITLAVLVCLCLYASANRSVFDKNCAVSLAFISAYMCVFFLPAMHERYSYLPEVLGLIVCFINKKTIVPYIAMLTLGLVTYGNYLFSLGVNIGFTASVVNLIIIVWYLKVLFKKEVPN